MKKNSFLKIFMSIFALFASIVGFLFLFRDKISTYAHSVKVPKHLWKQCPLHSIFNKKNSSIDNTIILEDDEDFCFEHAFDEDPANAREYVSLNINSHKVEEPIIDDSI